MASTLPGQGLWPIFRILNPPDTPTHPTDPTAACERRPQRGRAQLWSFHLAGQFISVPSAFPSLKRSDGTRAFKVSFFIQSQSHQVGWIGGLKNPPHALHRPGTLLAATRNVNLGIPSSHFQSKQLLGTSEPPSLSIHLLRSCLCLHAVTMAPKMC